MNRAGGVQLHCGEKPGLLGCQEEGEASFAASVQKRVLGWSREGALRGDCWGLNWAGAGTDPGPEERPWALHSAASYSSPIPSPPRSEE